MRVLVCGPRDMTDYWLVFSVLNGAHKSEPITAIIEGGALGADRFARRWANENGVANDPCAVDHALDGPWPAAGPRRNRRMLREKKPDRCVAFIADPPTPGTTDMVTQARKAGLPVSEIIMDKEAVMPNDMQPNAPVIDLAAALAPDKLGAWLEYEFAGHAAEGRALMARHAKFLEITANGIPDDTMAGHATDFANTLKDEVKATDATRTRIKAPVLHAQRLIDGGGKALIDPLNAAAATVQTKLTTYLREKEARLRAEAEAEAQRLALEAEAAIEAAQHDGGIYAQEVAVAAIHEAQQAEAQATAAPLELTRTRSQAGGLTGLKDNWTYTVKDLSKVPPHLLTINDAAVKLAIKQGTREIAGLEIWNDATAYVR